MAETPDGRTAIGEASDEAEAWKMVEEHGSQHRESVSWHPERQQWRWTLVVDGGKTHRGWAATAPKARLAIALAKNPGPVAHRMIIGRTPRGAVE